MVFIYLLIDTACQNINTMDHCYVSDPSCQSQQTTDETNNFVAVYVGVAVFVLIIILIGFLLRRFLRKQKEKRGMNNKSIGKEKINNTCKLINLILTNFLLS